MTGFNLSAPSQVTGLHRAIFEIAIAASAQKAIEEIRKAMLAHATRAMTSRLVLEIVAGSGSDQFHKGGKLKS